MGVCFSPCVPSVNLYSALCFLSRPDAVEWGLKSKNCLYFLRTSLLAPIRRRGVGVGGGGGGGIYICEIMSRRGWSESMCDR